MKRLNKKIKDLTSEQEALLPFYREKWMKMALSTEPIDREKAASAVKAAYASIDLPEPEIFFYSSPYAGLSNCLKRNWLTEVVNEEEWLDQINDEFIPSLGEQLFFNFEGQLEEHLRIRLYHELSSRIRYQLLKNQLWDELGYLLWDGFWWNMLGADTQCANTQMWVGMGAFYDFCTAVLNCVLYPVEAAKFKLSFRGNYDVELVEENNRKKWEIFQLLVKECGWIFAFEKFCIVCDRPRILSFDNEYRLHAEGSPAIQFADGYSLYAYHGVRLPEKYGKLHPQQWQAKWLLEEENAELRRVLIQVIGYYRISQELAVAELDCFREYTLLKIDTEVDIEPIYLLKMSCPSTGFTHLLRVPPDMKSAREAIAWVNWGIDPEEFDVQT